VPPSLTCRRGHIWDGPPAGAASCPTCGEPAVAAACPPTADLGATGPSGMAIADRPSIPGYEILGVLGRGGMGVVYKARQVKADRLVAVKLIALADPAVAARFRAEVEAIARLNHPNIVQVFEIGEAEGRPFYSLEYCPGGSLEGRLAGSPLSAAAAARLVETVARAAAAAHAAGVVHRDLKPANVLLTADGVPKLADFGIAKRTDAADDQTRTGSILGTPSYMAPEQALGESKRVGPACDVYALGAILYECLTGRPPFRAASLLETLDQVRYREPVPVRQLQPTVPRDLETIVLKCLRKEPARRYGSAAELADDLARFLDGRPILARPVGRVERAWRWSRRNPVGAALVASLVVGTALATGLAIWALGERDRAERAAVATRRNAEHSAAARGLAPDAADDLGGALLWYAKPLREDHGPVVEDGLHRQRLGAYLRHGAFRVPQAILVHPNATLLKHAAFSPDGRRIATVYHAPEGGNAPRAAVWDLAAAEPAPLALGHPGGAAHVEFSPDGQLAVTLGPDGTARVWDAATGAAVGAAVDHPGAEGFAAFLPDGRRLVTARTDGLARGELRVWDAATRDQVGEAVPLAVGNREITYSRSSGRVVTLVDGDVRVVDIATRQPVGPRIDPGEGIEGLHFSPDGERLAVSRRGAADVLEVATGRRVGPPVPTRHRTVTLGPTGRLLLAWGDPAAPVQAWDVATGRPLGEPIPHADFRTGPLAVSPDGRWAVPCGETGTVRLHALPSGKPAKGPLVHPWIQVTQAAFSPDGRRLLTVSGEAVYVWDLADPRGPAAGPAAPAGRVACWCRDGGRYLAVTGAGARVIDAASGAPVGPALDGFDPRDRAGFHPGGRLVVAYAAPGPGEGGFSLRAWEAATGRLVLSPFRLPPGTHGHDLSPDGEKLVVALGAANEARLWETRTRRPLGPPLSHPGAVHRAYFSPDGRRVVTCGLDQTARVWDATTGEPIGPDLEHDDEVRVAAFSPDGKRLVAGCNLTGARLWDAATGEPIGVPMPLPRAESTLFVAFSPDGRRVLTGSRGGPPRLWDAATGRPASIPLASHDVSDALFSADGGRVATVSLRGGARVWDVATGHPVSPVLPVLDGDGVGFRPDGRLLVAAGPAGSRAWDLSPDPRPAEDLVAFAELLAGYRLDPFGTRFDLTAGDLSAALRRLRSRYPDELVVTPERGRAWHRREAAGCLGELNVGAALFHAVRGVPIERGIH